MSKSSKSYAQFSHSRRRAKDRYDINLTLASYFEIIDIIQSGRAKFVEKQSNRVTIWQVEYENKTLKVVYDNKRKTIATVLPQKDSAFQSSKIKSR